MLFLQKFANLCCIAYIAFFNSCRQSKQSPNKFIFHCLTICIGSGKHDVFFHFLQRAVPNNAEFKHTGFTYMLLYQGDNALVFAILKNNSSRRSVFTLCLFYNPFRKRVRNAVIVRHIIFLADSVNAAFHTGNRRQFQKERVFTTCGNFSPTTKNSKCQLPQKAIVSVHSFLLGCFSKSQFFNNFFIEILKQRCSCLC